MRALSQKPSLPDIKAPEKGPRLVILDPLSPCIDHGQAGTNTQWGHYGTAYAETEAGRRRVRAHRMIFEAYHGYRPDVVMHDCDNTRCINVAHLSPGDYDANNKDRAAKGRSAQNVHSRRRLSDAQVREIRSMFVKGAPKGSPHGVVALARRFAVDPNVIYQVASRRTYRDVV